MLKSTWEKYKKPTPVKWRKIGDVILISSTSLSAIMMGAPISDKAQTWTIFILNVVGVLGKIITNIFKGDSTVPAEDSTTYSGN